MDGNQRKFLTDLGARLAAVRRERGLTQEQVAEVVGVDPQTIQRAENGRTSLSLARLSCPAQLAQLHPSVDSL